MIIPKLNLDARGDYSNIQFTSRSFFQMSLKIKLAKYDVAGL